MFGKDKNRPLVGAKLKREQAMKFKPNFQVESKREGKERSPIIPLAVIWGIAVILALILTEGPLKTAGLNFHSGNARFDGIFFGPGIASFTGNPESDRGIVIFLRGTLIFLLAGILPALTWLWQKLLDRAQMNVYLAFWGTTITVVLLYYLIRDSIGPLLMRIITNPL